MHERAVLAHGEDQPIAVDSYIRRTFGGDEKAVLATEEQVRLAAEILPRWRPRTPLIEALKLAVDPAWSAPGVSRVVDNISIGV